MPSRLEARSAAKLLWEAGERNATSAANLTGVPVRTMQVYFEKLRRDEGLAEKPRSGRPRVLNSTLRRQLGQVKSASPDQSATFYARELSRLSGRPVSIRSTRRALHELDYEWRLKPRRILTSAQKRQRVVFASGHLHDSWVGVWAGDQCTFKLWRHTRRKWIRAETNLAESKSFLPKLTEKLMHISLSIVVAIADGKKSTIGWLPKNWSSADLARVFEAQVYPSLQWCNAAGHQNTLIWDNDGRHFAEAWKSAESRLQLRPIRPWAANSPDLNPMENGFAWLKDFVEDKQPSSEQELRQAIIEAWAAFPIEHTKTLMRSMPRRLQAVLAHKGARTKY